MFTHPVSRLAVRALLAGLAAFTAQLQAGDPLTGTSLRAAVIAAVFAAVEIATPVNRAVGVGAGGNG